ncbi:adipocyte plasma membrane-associated protein-like [Datura stramonium]|uniref:Adipocyte plasma membrane-associated protein-like n=1 Tax=Datura stramonium TaxID=4076 RepID=A0ABS8RQ43_DATST|nr:adipocyte plasma membrane-associated protein-like [Datura stramonium]
MSSLSHFFFFFFSWPISIRSFHISTNTRYSRNTFYQLDSFDPASSDPCALLTRPSSCQSYQPYPCSKKPSDQLLSPEDVAYDPNSGVIYTGCVDGWVKKVTVNISAADSRVEDWVFTGGRPLTGFRTSREVIVAERMKGLLLNVTSEGEVKVLTEEAEGLKFKLASRRCRPYGRLLSYDPQLCKTDQTLLGDLYFANGVAVSPDQNSVIFCETLEQMQEVY